MQFFFQNVQKLEDEEEENKLEEQRNLIKSLKTFVFYFIFLLFHLLACMSIRTIIV